jgi:hypothetical protein
MSGRLLILILAIGTALTGWFFYQTLQQSSQFRHLATDQMAVEYVTYVKTFQKVDRLPVAESGTIQFFAPLATPWKFELHDKTLVAFVPQIESEPAGQTPNAEALASAQKTIESSLMSWLEDKYHTKKDLHVEVHLQPISAYDQSPTK